MAISKLPAKGELLLAARAGMAPVRLQSSGDCQLNSSLPLF